MQTAIAVSHWIKDVTQPDYKYYHPIQAALFAGCGYIGTASLTSISPIKGMIFPPVTYAINQFVGPYFLQQFEPYREVTLAPLACKVLHYSVAILLAKLTFSVVRKPLSLKEITQISAAFLVTLWIFRFILRYWRGQLKLFNNDTKENTTAPANSVKPISNALPSH